MLDALCSADEQDERRLKAVRDALAELVEQGEIQASSITPALIESQLCTNELPEPDLFIRTGGEIRISNFLLWQVSYAELWVTSKTWPEFDAAELDQAINAFCTRERRFGGLTQP